MTVEVLCLKEMEVRLERLKPLKAVCVHASGATPEEDAGKRIRMWAKSQGLLSKAVGSRLFGRNTYPTDKPEPHGYEYYLTVDRNIDASEDVSMGEVPGGSYAALRFSDLNRIGEAWKTLWKWIEENKREHVGFRKGEHGWVNGFEELLNWNEEKPPNEWIFDLWVQLKE